VWLVPQVDLTLFASLRTQRPPHTNRCLDSMCTKEALLLQVFEIPPRHCGLDASGNKAITVMPLEMLTLKYSHVSINAANPIRASELLQPLV
jgi:hypothetical protein